MFFLFLLRKVDWIQKVLMIDPGMMVDALACASRRSNLIEKLVDNNSTDLELLSDMYRSLERLGASNPFLGQYKAFPTSPYL